MSIVYSEIISGIIRIICAAITIVLTTVVVPWLKSEFIPWTKEKHLYGLVKNFVYAAEKLGETTDIDGAEKKEYVVRLLEAKGYAMTPELDAFIEGAVKEMDMAMNGYMDTIVDVFDEEDASDTEEPNI